MNKLLITVSWMVIFLSITHSPVRGQLNGDTYQEAKSAGYATWTLTYAEAPGFAAETEKGISGITIDIMEKFREYVQEKEKIKIALKFEAQDPGNFNLFLDQVKTSSGGVFGLSNTTITEDRKKSYAFSPPYVTNISMILTRNSVRTLMDIEDIAQSFKGMTAVTVKNSTNEKRILEIKNQYYPALTLEYVPSFREAMDMVLSNPKKFTHLDFTYYFDAIQSRQPVKRHPAGDDRTEEFGIIMPKNNDWAPLLAEFMSSGFLNSMEYKEIITRHLGKSAVSFFDSLK